MSLLVNISTLVANSEIRTEVVEGVEFTLRTRREYEPGDSVKVLLRPEDLKVYLEQEKALEPPFFLGRIDETVYKGATVDIILQLDSGKRLQAAEFFNETIMQIGQYVDLPADAPRRGERQGGGAEVEHAGRFETAVAAVAENDQVVTTDGVVQSFEQVRDGVLNRGKQQNNLGADRGDSVSQFDTCPVRIEIRSTTLIPMSSIAATLRGLLVINRSAVMCRCLSIVRQML